MSNIHLLGFDEILLKNRLKMMKTQEKLTRFYPFDALLCWQINKLFLLKNNLFDV